LSQTCSWPLTRPGQPQYRTDEDAQYRAMREVLRKVKLRQLV
jgi:hypothetical protein